MAAAGTLVLIAGGIDLSVGAVYGLAGATAAQLSVSFGPPVGITAGILVGLVVGLANGVIVTRFRINPLIGTLAVSFVVAGIGAIATKGNLIVVFDHPEFKIFAASKIAGISTAAWMMIVIAVATAILLSRTTFGRYVYATGGNAEAARLGGVRINTVRIATFALSGMAAALAGTLDASRVLSAQASAGSFLTFTVLTGIIVGGTSIQGGEGSVGRTVVGCLFVALVANGFNLLGLDPVLPAGHARHHPPARGRDRRLVPAPGLRRSSMVHAVTRIDWSFADTPLPASATSSGLARQVLVGPAQGAVHTELAAGSFAPGGWLARHAHSFEEALYVLEGELAIDIGGDRPPARRRRLLADDDRDVARARERRRRRRVAGCR